MRFFGHAFRQRSAGGSHRRQFNFQKCEDATSHSIEINGQFLTRPRPTGRRDPRRLREQIPGQIARGAAAASTW